MYSLIIAEDEFTTRRALANLIPWSSLGFQVDGVFSDGNEVIEFLGNNIPDVILTDIKMISVSGIEIARTIKEQNLPIQVVFLSAYSDFSYAKEAIECGVTNYLLKPVDLSNLRTVFSNIKNSLDKQNAELISKREKLEHYKTLISYEKQQFVTDVYFGALKDPATQLKRLKLIDTAADQDAALSLILLEIILLNDTDYQCFLRNYGLPETQERLLYILESIDDNLEFYPIKWHTTPTGELKMLGVFWVNGPCTAHDVQREKIQNAVHDWLALNVSVTVLRQLNSLEELASIKWQIGKATTRIRLMEDLEYLELLREQSQLLCSYLYQNNLEQAIELCDTFADNCMRCGIDFAYRQFVVVIIRLIDEIAKNDLILRNQLYAHCMDLNMNVLSRTDLIKDWLNNCVCYLLDIVNIQFENREEKSSEKVIAFLRDHFNEDITLTYVAENVFLNPTYISRLIKKEYGKTYTEILMELRVEHAVKLLRDSDMRVCDIAEVVGYSNLKYFYKVFRKVTGKSPSDYRKGDF